MQQSTFDEDTTENVQVIYVEIIDLELELVNPFWLVSYAEQKLLDVCNEEQKMKILVVPINYGNCRNLFKHSWVMTQLVPVHRLSC